MRGALFIPAHHRDQTMKYIENGIQYGYRVYKASAEYCAAITSRSPRTYGPVKPCGQRVALIATSYTTLGQFPTKKDAVWAAKQWLQMRFGGAQ